MRSWCVYFCAAGLALCICIGVNCKSAPPKPIEPPPAPVAQTPIAEPVSRVLPSADEMQVAVIGELAMRAAPGRKSQYIMAMPYGAKVQIVDRFGPEDLARGVEGHWYRVSYRGKTGWAFGGFLREPGERHRYRLKGRRAVRVN